MPTPPPRHTSPIASTSTTRAPGRGGAHPDAAGWVAEARDAFAWAEAQPDRTADSRRLRQLAAVCLYLATGEAPFQEAFRAEWRADDQRNHGMWVSPSANGLASAVYVVSCKDRPGLDAAFHKEVTANVVGRADYSTRHREEVGFRFGGVDPGQGVGMNLITVPRTLFQAVAHEATGERKYLDAMHAALAYVLGGNQENRSHLSGVGHEREQDAFVPTPGTCWTSTTPRIATRSSPACRPTRSRRSTSAARAVRTGPGAAPCRGRTLAPRRTADAQPLLDRRQRVHRPPEPPVVRLRHRLPPPDRAGDRPRFSRPTVKLDLAAGEAFRRDRPVRLSARTSADAARVEYFYDWHFAGASSEPAGGFALDWDISQTDLKGGAEVRITAIAYDARGESTLPTPEGEAKVRIADEPRESR
jgi:hypothetical protein